MTGASLLCFFIPLLLLLLLCFHCVESTFSSSCSTTRCNGVEITYPFFRLDDSTATNASNVHCGYPGFGLTCPSSNDSFPILTLPADSYYITQINYSAQSLTLVDIDVSGKTCPRVQKNFTIDTLPLDYNPNDVNLTFYFNCSFESSTPPNLSPITCLAEYPGKHSYVVLEGTAAEGFNWTAGYCEDVVVATVQATEVTESQLISQFGGAMGQGFVLDWEAAKDCGACELTKGKCGFNNRTNEFLCFCGDGSFRTNASLTYCQGT